MKSQNTIEEVREMVDRTKNDRTDFLVNSHNLHLDEVVGAVPRLISMKGDNVDIVPSDTMYEQLFTHLNIPTQYGFTLRDEQPELLTDNVNGRLQHKPESLRMIRTIGDRGRAFLSDKYRRLNNEVLLDKVQGLILDEDLDSISCSISEEGMRLNLVRELPSDKITKKVGDAMSIGVSISNNEVGRGCARLELLLYTLVCTNGMIISHSYGAQRKQHIGAWSQNGRSENEFWSQFVDAIPQILDPESHGGLIDQIAETREEPIRDLDMILINLHLKGHLQGNESVGIRGHLESSGDLTRYGLINAVTRFSQENEVGFSRSMELNALAGHMLTFDIRGFENN